MMENLKQAAKEKFGAIIQKVCPTEKLPNESISPRDKFFTRYNRLKKDLGSYRMTNKNIIVRPAKEEDIPFLFATYLKHNWYDKTNSTLLPKIVWINAQRKRLQKIYDENKIKIACLNDDADLIMGYGFLDLDNKPFVYVKKHYRNQQENVEDLLKENIKGDNK